MGFDHLNIDDVEENHGLKFLRDPLNAEKLGLTVIDRDKFEGMQHNHAENDHEEIYLLIEGDASMYVDGDEIEMREGDAIRVDPEMDRKIHSENGLLMVIAGAP